MTGFALSTVPPPARVPRWYHFTSFHLMKFCAGCTARTIIAVLKTLLLVPVSSLPFRHSGQNFVYISHLSRDLHAAPIPSSDHPNNMGPYFVDCLNKSIYCKTQCTSRQHNNNINYNSISINTQLICYMFRLF